MRWCTTFALVAVAIPTCMGQCLTSDDAKKNTNPSAQLALYSGQQAFSLDMLKTIVQGSASGNIFFSPYSTYYALLLAYFGSAGSTETKLQSALHLNELDKLGAMQAYRLEKFFLRMRAVNSSGYELIVSNRLYFQNDTKLRECMEHLFEEEIQRLDFVGAPEESRETINHWVEQQTKDRIKDLIPPGKITPNTNLVLVNSAYFKGLWQSKFQPQSTRREIFYISPTEQAFVTMMRQKGHFNHLVSETLGAHVLELPYKGEDVSMIVLLPPFVKKDGIEAVIENLTPENLQEAMDSMITRPVEVSFPKFGTEQTVELVPVLEKLGLGELFQGADLSGFTADLALHLDDAIHKAQIEVTEEGSVAAAATAIFSFRSSRPLDPAKFTCNHPFVFLIYDKISKTILFMGVFRTPRL